MNNIKQSSPTAGLDRLKRDQYVFGDVIFTPQAENALMVAGVAKSLSVKQRGVLQLLLDNNGQTCSNDLILETIWPGGSHDFTPIRKATSIINQRLKPHAEIKNVRAIGYVLTVDDLVVKVIEHDNTAFVLAQNGSALSESELPIAQGALPQTLSAFSTKPTIVALAMMAILLFIALGIVASDRIAPAPLPSYTVINSKAFFTRDSFVNTPKLSPDERYIIHTLANQDNNQAYLALSDLTTGEIKPLVPMKLIDGLKWHPSGNQIVYQDRVTDGCEIRLLKLDENKDVVENQLLSACLASGGVLSFAWFSEHEFYVNLATGKSDGLSIHHIYAFDIRTKQATKILTAKNEGVGYYSLEYDSSIGALYMLHTQNFADTNFYRYQAGKLQKLATVDHPIQYFAANDNQLVYKSSHNNFVINQPANDFVNQKVLLPAIMEPIAKPNISGSKITFLAGGDTGYTLNKLTNGQLDHVNLKSFNPGVIANFKASLVFASAQTGINQLYWLTQQNQVVKISHMQNNEYIKNIDTAGNVFALSYRTRVDLYQYINGQLQLLHSLPGFTNGYLANDASTVLLSKLVDDKTTAQVVELKVIDTKPTGLVLKQAIMGVYKQNEIVYLDNQHQLMRYVDDQQLVIAKNININTPEQTTLYKGKFYYISKHQGQSTLFVYDFTDDTQTTVPLNGEVPTWIAVINDELYIQIRYKLRPKLMVGDIVPN